MKNEVTVTPIDTSEGHGHPRFDITWSKDKRAIFDNKLEISGKKFEDKIEVLFRREDVEHLQRLRLRH